MNIKKSGFTLIELLIVISIIALLLTQTIKSISTMLEYSYSSTITNNLETTYECVSDILKAGKNIKDKYKLSNMAYALDNLSIDNKTGAKFINYTKTDVDYSTYVNIIYVGVDEFENNIANIKAEDNIFIVYYGRSAKIYYGERDTDSLVLYATVW